MPVLFNSVKTYIEAVGRQRDIKHWNTLDSLTVIQTGPTLTVETWIPKIGMAHLTYPTMTFDSAQVVNEVAGVTTLRCTYVGKYYSMGPVAVGSSSHQGEISWTSYNSFQTWVSTPAAPPSINSDGSENFGSPPVYSVEFISYSWLSRFTITTAIYKTLSRIPNISLAEGGGTMTNQVTFRTARSVTTSGMGMVVATLTFQDQLLESSANPLNNGWYEISETWAPQPIIVTTLENIASTLTTTPG